MVLNTVARFYGPQCISWLTA